MPASLVQPDLEFKANILRLGAHDLSACYQCGTCSVVCPIATEANPFPRKEMIWVQWGLKDRLVADSGVWLCHQCNHCNTYCPRDARPADVMAALREYSIGHYAVPRFMGNAVSAPKYLPLLLAFPAVILLLVLAFLGHLSALPAGTIVFSKFMPIPYIEGIYVAAVGTAVCSAVLSGLRYWKALNKASPLPGGNSMATPLRSTLRDIFQHKVFQRCAQRWEDSRETYKTNLRNTHLAIFYGFLGLVVTTSSVAIGIYVFHYLTPWPLWHPVKILGNGSGVAVLVACGIFFSSRLTYGEKAGKNSYTDWLFLAALGATVLTGFLCELFRLGGAPALAYPTYFIHLVLIFFLLVYLPYSKFAHLIYRSVAMLHEAQGEVSHMKTRHFDSNASS